jgi:hypothetical protein
MTDGEIKKEFSKAMNYQEVFMTATKLKQSGVDQLKVNKYLSMRRKELAKLASKILQLSITQLDTSMADPEDVMVTLPLNYQSNGNTIEWNGKEVILR